MTKKEMWDALKDNYNRTCDICNTSYKYLIFMGEMEVVATYVNVVF